MPAPVLPPQTLKQAKRAYQKSSKGFTFTASQERAAARRNAKDEYARTLREKEQRSKNNKRKRDEKEEKERQAKKVLIQKGQLSEDALLPKVRSSQPRLSAFLRQPKKPMTELLPPLLQREEDEETVEVDSDEEKTLVNDNRPPVPSPSEMDEEELDDFFSIAPSGEENMAVIETNQANRLAPQRLVTGLPPHPQEPAPELRNVELEAQLGYRLSQAMVDFEICEDPLSDSGQAPITTPSPRKRKRIDDSFSTPSKSVRSALSEMSPGRVFLRSQEKPDTISAPPFAARMLSPRQNGPTPSQLAEATLAMISTQDIADDLEFSDAKENTDPVRDVSSCRQPLDCTQGNFAGRVVAEPEKSTSAKLRQKENVDVDDNAFDELMDADEIDDFDDHDLTEAEWAGLSTQPQKNTAVSLLGSPKKAKAITLQTPSKTMAPPPRPSPVADLITKLKAATPKKPIHILARVDQQSPSTSRSFDFDDGISDADLAGIDMSKHNERPNTDLVKPAGALAEYELPSASQSFGLDDGMDDDLLALVEETDFAGSSATKKARKGRTLPWENRPTNWNAMMADSEQIERQEGTSQRSA